MVLAETAAEKLLVDDGRVVGVRTGDKGRGQAGEPLANFEPGSDIVARVTVLAEGTQGHLTGVALDHFGLRPAVPAGVGTGGERGVAGGQAARPSDSHYGLAAAAGARYREFGGSFIYPMGPDHVAIGMVVGLDYRDASLSVHDLLQELKTHPKIRPILEGGERLEWGAKTIPGGGFTPCLSGCTRPGCCSAATAPDWSTSLPSRASTTPSSRAGWRPRPSSGSITGPSRPALASLRPGGHDGFIGQDLHE